MNIMINVCTFAGEGAANLTTINKFIWTKEEVAT